MRTEMIRRSISCTALACAMTGALVYTQSQSSQPWAPITAERLLNPEPGDWLNYRRTYDVSAFSPLRQIDRTNVQQLRSIWSYSVRDSSRWLPTPIVANGLMFVSEGLGRVLAFDAVSGDVVWIHERHYPEDIAVSEGYPRARGVSIYGDKIYWATADCYLVSLDARTGKLVSEIKTCDSRNGEGHNHPPLIADGKVFVGHAGGDRTGAGRFRAYDVESGTLLWTVYTAPRPGDPGYETWAGRDIRPLGAAPWNTASYDPVLHLVYFSTGNPEPWPVSLRGPGDALYAVTVLAVDSETGKIRWHFQTTPEDSWDRAGFENVLVDLAIDGRMRKVLIQTGKMGWGIVLDRETGEFLRAFKTAFDNVITGWTKEGRPTFNPAVLPQPADANSGKVFEVCPHIHGARNLQASSYSPITNLYYLGINNSCMDAKIVPDPYVAGRRYSGLSYSAKLAPGYDYVGEFVAFDPVTGKRAWTYRRENGSAMTASALATAGGVVFGGTADRQFFALEAESGRLLWQTRLNGDVSGAPITFTVGGTQYVAVGAGGRSASTTSFGPLTGVDISRGSGAIWVFGLPSATNNSSEYSAGAASRPVLLSSSGVAASSTVGGRGNAPSRASAPDSIPATAGAAIAGSTPSGRFSAAQAYRGQQQYNSVCAACHTVTEHTAGGFVSKWGGGTVGDVFNQISTTMPENRPGSLAPEDYASIVAFFLSQSGYSPGSQELPADRSVLQTLHIQPIK